MVGRVWITIAWADLTWRRSRQCRPVLAWPALAHPTWLRDFA